MNPWWLLLIVPATAVAALFVGYVLLVIAWLDAWR